MTWELHAHEAVLDSIDDLGDPERKRVRGGLDDVRDYLAATDGAVGPAAPRVGPEVPRPDLQPLASDTIRGSYRLRVGPFRAALVVLPDEAMVLVTVLRRRSETTYSDLARLHERRLADR